MTTEQIISHILRAILIDLPLGADIPTTNEFRTVNGFLEQYLPELLAVNHQEWKHESLDGFYYLVAKKIGDGEVELFGLCILISDQTTTPIHLRLQLHWSRDKIAWLECRLGETGVGGMVRTKMSRDVGTSHLPALKGRADKIDWVYKVTFGQKC